MLRELLWWQIILLSSSLSIILNIPSFFMYQRVSVVYSDSFSSLNHPSIDIWRITFLINQMEWKCSFLNFGILLLCLPHIVQGRSLSCSYPFTCCFALQYIVNYSFKKHFYLSHQAIEHSCKFLVTFLAGEVLCPTTSYLLQCRRVFSILTLGFLKRVWVPLRVIFLGKLNLCSQSIHSRGVKYFS